MLTAKDEVEGKECRVKLHKQARHLFMTGEISEKHYRMVVEDLEEIKDIFSQKGVE